MEGGDGIGQKNLELALARKTEVALDGGIATGGGNTTLDDATKDWTVNQWATGLSIIQIIKPTGAEYFRVISANTTTQITFAALPGGVNVVAGDLYSVRVIGGGTVDLTDRWNRQLGQIDLARVLGAALAHANPVIMRLTTGAGFDLDLTTFSRFQRWGRNVTPAWTHAAEVVAPGAGTALVTRLVGAGVNGYIYGFFISCQETNDFLLNWTSGGAARSKRIVFGGAGSTEVVDQVALNEGLPADGATNITITNVNAAGAGKVYQANLLYAEV